MLAMMLGALFGFLVGTPWGIEGAAAGGMIGMLVGLTVHGFTWGYAHSGNAPVVEHHRLMCTPSGTLADCELSGDAQRGRWLDVRSCSLLRSGEGVTCDKTCLHLMNDSRIRPGRRCDCE